MIKKKAHHDGHLLELEIMQQSLNQPGHPVCLVPVTPTGVEYLGS
jgi:hypothetical protein